MSLSGGNYFDFIVGNLPWDDEIDKKILIKCKNELLSQGGTLALITSASWLRGAGSKNRELRSVLIHSGNIKKICTYPAEVFINQITQKPIKAIGASLLYTKDEKQTDTTLVRYFGDTALITTSDLHENNGIMLYFGDEGKQLWDICIKRCKKVPLLRYTPSDKPKIHFSSKIDLNYLGSSKPLGSITGKNLLTGVKLDIDGSNGWVPELKIDSDRTLDDNAAKRYMLEFDYNQEHLAQNSYYHFSMRLFGILLGMTSTISHVNRRTLGELPCDILQKKYNSIEEYEKAYYESKNLTQEMVDWIKSLGNNYGDIKNLKGDDTVFEIARSIDRIKKTGEVFTPVKYVDDMLTDLIPLGMCQNDRRILEPCCGDGNFVVAIIKKKLNENMSPTDALKTTYAIDLMEDNVKLCRARILNLVGDTNEHRILVEHNIVQANVLKSWDFRNWCRKETQEEYNQALLGI